MDGVCWHTKFTPGHLHGDYNEGRCSASCCYEGSQGFGYRFVLFDCIGRSGSWLQGLLPVMRIDAEQLRELRTSIFNEYYDLQSGKVYAMRTSIIHVAEFRTPTRQRFLLCTSNLVVMLRCRTL